MSIFRNFVVMGAVAMIASSSALAGGGKGEGQRPVKEVSWEEFVERCANPTKFDDVQVQPQNIFVTCKDRHLRWVEDKQKGEVPLPEFREVSTEVDSHKFHVAEEKGDRPVFSKPGQCAMYREVEETLAITKNVSCQEIIGVGKNGKSSLVDFCAAALDTGKSVNKGMVEVRETGRMNNTCGKQPKL